MSNYFDILSSVATTIQGLNLSGLSTVVIRKLPAAQEVLDVLPMLVISPKDIGETLEYSGFESNIFATYGVDVVIFSMSNRDLSATTLPTYMAWRAQIRDAYQGGPPIPNATSGLIASTVQIKVEPDPILSRELINLAYDYQALSIYFKVNESTTSG